MPVVTFHGTDDQYLAYTGGYGPKVADLPAPGGGTIGTGLLAVGDSSLSVPETVAAKADARLRIPVRAGLRSLNVATAAAIGLYEALRQRQVGDPADQPGALEALASKKNIRVLE